MNNRLTFLVIDDEFVTRTQLRNALESLGHNVLEACDGSRGLEIVAQERPDIVMTDLRMPVMDGEAVLGHLRRTNPDLPVIIVSGTGDIQQAVVTLRNGAWDYIVKPVRDLELLRAVINRANERSRLIIENRKYQQHLETLVRDRAKELLKLSQVATQSPVSIVITDTEGRIEFVNPKFCQVTGYSSDEVMGRNPSILRSGKTRPEIYHQLWTTITTGGVWEGELENKKKNGDFFNEHTIISPIKDNNEIISHYMAIKEDITEKLKLAEEAKQAQLKLIQADKLSSLGLLVSGIAHEINNPNNFIMNNSAHLAEAWQSVTPILEEYYQENGDFELGDFRYSESKDVLDRLFTGLTEGSRRIRAIVDRLKNFARQDSGSVNERTDLNTVVLDAIAILNHEIKKRCEKFRFDAAEKLPEVRANAQQIGQVVINLLMNALQSLPDRERAVKISIHRSPDSGDIAVVVEDEGTGMSQETIQRIREPFFTTKSDRGGTGLGLSVSDSLAQENGGTLLFSSEPGKGTTAMLTLKAYNELLQGERLIQNGHKTAHSAC